MKGEATNSNTASLGNVDSVSPRKVLGISRGVSDDVLEIRIHFSSKEFRVDNLIIWAMQIIPHLVHRMPGVYGRYWVWIWYCWCRGFNQSCLSIAAMMFAIDGYSFLPTFRLNIYPNVAKKSCKNVHYICVSKSNISHDTQLPGASKRELRKLTKDSRNQKTKIPPTFSSQSGIYRFWWCLALELMLSERELRQFELRASDFVMLW